MIYPTSKGAKKRKNNTPYPKKRKKPKGKQLSDFEKGKIVAFHDVGLSVREISKKVGKHFSTISRVIKNFKETGSHKRISGSGRKRKTSERERR